MRKIRIVLVLAALLTASPIFADEGTDNKSCETIAKACLDGGYVRDDSNKKFWDDCMKPVIMGKTVKGVTVDAAMAKDCRTYKIEKMKREVKEMEKVS